MYLVRNKCIVYNNLYSWSSHGLVDKRAVLVVRFRVQILQMLLLGLGVLGKVSNHMTHLCYDRNPLYNDMDSSDIPKENMYVGSSAENKEKARSVSVCIVIHILF